MNFTPAQYRFYKEANLFLQRMLQIGKDCGKVPPDTTLFLCTDNGELRKDMSAAVELRQVRRKSGKTRNYYFVYLSRAVIEVQDFDTVRHEGGHVLMGHPSNQTPGSFFMDWNDFNSYARQELEADYNSRRLCGMLDGLPNDLARLANLGIDFGYEPAAAYNEVKWIAREMKIPCQYMKQLVAD